MGEAYHTGNILLRAYIATWTGTHAGTLLYTSPDHDFANTGDEHLMFSTGGLTLTPGETYVAFLSVSELYGQSFGQSSASVGDPTIPGGTFVFSNNSGDFDALFTNSWDATDWKPDWAFSATFNAATGNVITLAATVKRQGGKRSVALTWSPADGGTLDVRRNAVVIGTTDDDGETRDKLRTHTGTFLYQVCETDSGDCSNAVRVVVPGD